MIIVLVLMSILSIIALSVTMTSVRDKEEKAQNNQYQAYYAVGENKLLDFQQFIGKDTISSLSTNLTLTGDTGTAAGTCDAINGTSRTCTFDNINLANDISQTAEIVKTIITVTDSSEITNFSAQKDKDILLDIQTATTPTIIIDLDWSGVATAWNFTVDKKDYTSEKAVFSPAGIFSQIHESYSTGTCFSYTKTATSAVRITINCPSERMFFRLRPLMTTPGASTLINRLTIQGNTIPLQRTLTNTTTTVNSGNADNPTVVLETTYLLIGQPLSLFDYVLRTESDVIKN
jgi:type II secretory pathway pseudopilin PulG